MTMMAEKQRVNGRNGMDENRVRRVSETVEISDVTGAALEIIRRDDLQYLPVVAEDTSKLVGVVMRKGLERGCWGMGHDSDRCRIHHHLKTDVEFWFEDDPLDEGALEKANHEPIVVVDRDLKPVAIVQAERAASD